MDGEVQDNPTVITMDSTKWASDPLLALEGAAQEVPREPCASAEDGVLDGGLLMLLERWGRLHWR